MNKDNEHTLISSIQHHMRRISTAVESATTAYSRPSVLYRPKIGFHGKLWRVYYGEGETGAVAGYGETPDEAMKAFDFNWYNQRVNHL